MKFHNKWKKKTAEGFHCSDTQYVDNWQFRYGKFKSGEWGPESICQADIRDLCQLAADAERKPEITDNQVWRYLFKKG